MSQVSLPLALHLRSPVTYNFFTNERWKPGEMYQEGRNINEFAFIDAQSGRSKSTLLFAHILRTFYYHPDWSQLHAFFTKRYSKSQMLSDREARKLTAPEDAFFNPGKKITVNFKTDPSSVGLPSGLTSLLATAGRTVRSGVLGPDPQPCAIGPAIGIAVGAGAYMDLVYCNNQPGKYPERRRIGSELYGWENGKFQAVIGALATTKKGGRGRSWAEWADLWSVIAEWVYEHDATSLEHHFMNTHSYKYRLSDEENRKIPFGAKVPREYLSTDAIDAADAVRDVFDQLAANPTKFQGIEWDFLELEVKKEVREAFYTRFGRKELDPKKIVEGLGKHIDLEGWNRLSYNQVSPVALKPCPDSFLGAGWESWLLSIEGGDVVVVKTMFQALWAIMLLSQLPVNIQIIDKEENFPKYRDPESIYL